MDVASEVIIFNVKPGRRQDALAAIKRTHRDVKILGSYRRSGARATAEAERIAADDAGYRAAATWLASWRERITR